MVSGENHCVYLKRANPPRPKLRSCWRVDEALAIRAKHVTGANQKTASVSLSVFYDHRRAPQPPGCGWIL